MIEYENPNCVETHATFRVTGDQLDPAAVTRMLGIEPSFGRRKGDVYGGPTRPIKSPTGVWALESAAAVSSRILDDHLRYLLGRVGEPTPTFGRYIGEHGLKMDLFCFWMSATGQGGPAVSSEILKQIVKLGAALDFDIYFADEDDEEKEPPR